MTKPKVVGPVVLAILDGFGIASESYGNAVTLASTHFLDSAYQKYPVLSLQASGEVVGLPWGEMGNSEVGHLSLGSGMILYQTLPRITRAIASRTFFENQAFEKAFEHAQTHHSTMHLIGLASDGGVHSMLDHTLALLEYCAQKKFTRVVVHTILDGRDTPRSSAERYVQRLQEKMKELQVGKIATLSGRFYAMDRDNRWDRIEKAYRAMVLGESDAKTSDPISAIEASYEKNIFDEECVPTVLCDAQGAPLATIQSHDAVILTNFRPDRMRQLTESLTVPSFAKFPLPRKLEDLFVVSMVEYDKHLPVNAVAFPPVNVENPLAKILSDHGMQQLHIAETEKYPHVTYFFNGGREDAFAGEQRVLIPSAQVASYDEKPSMSAVEIRDRMTDELRRGVVQFVVVNFANADMVGHTGNLPATIKAIEVLDEVLKTIADVVLELDGVLLITADHGNAEELLQSRTGDVSKEHTTNPVPIYFIGKLWENIRRNPSDLSHITPAGILADVAPTILEIFDLPVPKTMTGRSLLSLIEG